MKVAELITSLQECDENDDVFAGYARDGIGDCSDVVSVTTVKVIASVGKENEMVTGVYIGIS